MIKSAPLNFIIFFILNGNPHQVFQDTSDAKIKELSKNVWFKHSFSEALSDTSLVYLDSIAFIMKTNRFNYKIESYSGSRGKQEDNLLKTIKRANNLKKEFISRGVSRSRLFTEGFGEKNPRYSMPRLRHMRDRNDRIKIYRVNDSITGKRH